MRGIAGDRGRGWRPERLYRVAEAPMRVMVRHNIDRAYRRLKHLLESRIDDA